MKYILLLLSMLLFLACGENNKTNKAAQMHWDRDMCSRCVMVISDRKNSVQVQNKTTHKYDKFDDLGCMVIWAEEEKRNISKDFVVWVTDVTTGEWIDAKKALYTSGNTTPMDYGYSAYKLKSEVPNNKQTFSFDEVYNLINK